MITYGFPYFKHIARICEDYHNDQGIYEVSILNMSIPPVVDGCMHALGLEHLGTVWFFLVLYSEVLDHLRVKCGAIVI